jgi:CDP-glucose 4,6-dehydratase
MAVSVAHNSGSKVLSAMFRACGLDKRIISIEADVHDEAALTQAFKAYNLEIVFHLAAQPLVR